MTAVCPECVAGKHGNCDGTAWSDELDQRVACSCSVCAAKNHHTHG